MMNTVTMVKQDRSFVLWVVFYLLTCGFYHFYWQYRVVKDINTICRGDGEETPGVLKFTLLSIVTAGIYGYYWYYKLGDRIYRNGPRYGVPVKEDGGTMLIHLLLLSMVCGIGTFTSMYIFTKNINALATAYNNYFAAQGYVLVEE